MIYLILFLISFSLTYFIKNYMIKKSLVAVVNERSSHTVPTPHGGGIALAITWFIGLMYLYFIGAKIGLNRTTMQELDRTQKRSLTGQ